MTAITEYSHCSANIKSLLGRTPLIQLKTMFPNINVYGKLEFYNPSGSIKDRPIAFMIQNSLETGKISRGDTIVIPTSGNTGLGACVFAKPHELKVISVLPNDVPVEKINLLRAYGSKIILCDFNRKSDEEGGYVSVAKQISQKIKNAILLDQFNDELNPLAHYLTTGPEIWEQMEGKIDYFFSGIGSGGTISGIGRFLKQKNPNIRIIGIEPKGGINKRVFDNSEYIFEDHLISGVSDNFLSANIDFKQIDEIIEIEDKEALQRCHDLIYHETICAGSSSGLVLEGIRQFLQINDDISFYEKNIVTVFPDSGTKYQNSLLNPTYLRKIGNDFISFVHSDEDEILRYLNQQNAVTEFYL